ncbi:MAG TPA: hypothetical protein VIH76_15185 [Candidatus Acidoferrales bacterium]
MVVSMISALIFVISLAALGQFALLSWRAAFLTVAAKPVSEEIRAALGAYAPASETENFQSAAEWLKLSPNLGGEDRRIWPVRLYFVALRGISAATKFVAPSMAGWSQREMSACARFVAVVAGERLQRNRLCMAQMQSF